MRATHASTFNAYTLRALARTGAVVRPGRRPQRHSRVASGVLVLRARVRGRPLPGGLERFLDVGA